MINDKTLYVNLFIASELTWKARGLKLRQETRYPEEQGTRLVITTEQPVELTLKLRHPAWAGSGFAIKVNGEPLTHESQPGSYAEVSRSWKTGDTIEVALPFSLHTRGLPRQPQPPRVLARAAGALRPDCCRHGRFRRS